MENSTRRSFGAQLAALSAAQMLPGCAQTRLPSRIRAGWEPAYLQLYRSGELERRVAAFSAMYRSCRLCPRQCGVDRKAGERGICRGTARVRIAASHPHFGEERTLVGRYGSGTIFFSRCSLLCEFCQNWEINHRGDGLDTRDEGLARTMIDLQKRGCHNINVVTPSHYAPNIVAAVAAAIPLGLRIPIVWNCGGYESLEAVKLLDGIVDIYLPDFKYSDGNAAAKFSRGAADYPEAAAAAIEEMHRQVGDLVTDEDGIAFRGLLIRHLVLPDNLAGTDKFVRWVATNLGQSTCVNIMGQYRPEHRAYKYPEISRRTTKKEHAQATAWARDAGIRVLN